MMSSDSFIGATFSGNAIEIPMIQSNIQVVEDIGVLYFNVVAQQPVENNGEASQHTGLVNTSIDELDDGGDIIIEYSDAAISNVAINNEEEAESSRNTDDLSEIHVCPLCKAFFATSLYLKAHMKRKCIRAKNIDNTFECEYCPLSFKQRFQLVRHMMQHTGERPFKCETCLKTFLTKSHLKRHAVVHLPQDQLKHKCNQCDKVFAWASTLVSHLKSHSGEKRFKCGICGRKFLHLNSLRSHTVNRHTVNGLFTCVVCKECFNEAADLISHMKTHNEQESVKCTRCYSFFTSLNDLETHVCTNFGGKPLVCVKCNVEFDDTNTYCNHTCMQLNTNRKCGCCSKELKSLWHLREHLITHTAEKPFKCERCLQSFRRKRELDIHTTRHGDERPFTCLRCTHTFTSDNYLKQHMRKEHREKKFICGVCYHAFMHKCALNNHMSFHLRTGNKKYGKKYHRDDGLLVEELVQARLSLKNVINMQPELENIFNETTIPIKAVDLIFNQDENLNIDDSIGLQEEILSSEVKDESCLLHVNTKEDSPILTNCVDDHFLSKVIQPRIELRNAEQDPSNITTIYQTDSSGALTIRCASCYQHCSSHSMLLRHRKEFHNDGKPYQCDFCSRTFSIAANLSQHRSIHNIKRKYSCNDCGKSYKVTHKLREHLKLKHHICTDNLTDLDLQLKYGLSFPGNDIKSTLNNNLLLTPIEYMPDVISIENNIFHDNTSKLLCNTTNPLANKNDCDFGSSHVDNISKVTSTNLVYIDSKASSFSAMSGDELCKRNVSFLMNITKLINDISDAN